MKVNVNDGTSVSACKEYTIPPTLLLETRLPLERHEESDAPKTAHVTHLLVEAFISRCLFGVEKSQAPTGIDRLPA